ncbi:MAG: acyl-CoA dehydrogenase family protein [Euryarchaeota archaeon]|nr:acyl-CoA dehydrogenase family protein [Euryarchaeota archaeon]
MDLRLTDDQRLLQRTAREFVEQHVKPYVREWELKGAVPDTVYRKMGELGFLGAPIPEDLGGSGLDAVSYAILTEELAKGCSSLRTSLSVNASLFGTTLNKFGSEEQKEKWLRPTASGKKLGAWALTEAQSGSDAAAMKTRATRKGKDYILNGSKMWISNGAKADFVVVYASTDPKKRHEGISCFVAEKGTKGFKPGVVETTNKLGLRSSPTAELVFEDCHLPEANRVGKEGQGWEIAMHVLNHGRLSVAAGAVGIAQAAFEAATDYAKKRMAFDRPIGAFQLVKAKLADMATQVEAGRLLVWNGALMKERFERGDATYDEWGLAVSKAKLFTAEMCVKVAEEAIQIHGANGYTNEYPVERYWRDAKICGIYEGTNEIQRLIIARHVLGKEFSAT